MELLDASAMKIAKKLVSDNPEKLHDICNEIFQYKNLDPRIKKSSEKIAKMAADKGDSAEYLFTYSKILKDNDKTKKAIRTAEKALSKLKEGSREAKMIEEWITNNKS